MGRIWTEESKYWCWLQVEAAASTVLAEDGVIPAEAAEAIATKAGFTVARIQEIEAEVKHDVIASGARRIGPAIEPPALLSPRGKAPLRDDGVAPGIVAWSALAGLPMPFVPRGAAVPGNRTVSTPGNRQYYPPHSLAIRSFVRNHNRSRAIPLAADGASAALQSVCRSPIGPISFSVSFRREFSVRALLLSAFCVAAWGVVFGSVRGVVHDPDHRPVIGAQAVLKSVDSDFSRTLSSGEDGGFEADAIPVGIYRVTVTYTGFAPMEQEIVVASGSAPILHFQLKLGAVTESLERDRGGHCRRSRADDPHGHGQPPGYPDHPGRGPFQ